MSKRIPRAALLRSKSSRRPNSARPLLEALEGRLVPASYTVNSALDAGAGSGTTGDLRYCLTQADANPGSTIQFDGTVFAAPQTIALNGTELPAITAKMAITGPAAGVTISGNLQSQVLVVGDGTHNPNVTLANLTITQGKTTGNGGGIDDASTGTLSLTNCTLSGNSAADGGGLYNGFGTVTLIGCTVSGNSATEGGGLYNNGTAKLTGCTLGGNSASDVGGGLFNFGTAALSDCTLSGNSASHGAGLANDNGGAATLGSCTLSGNSASYGGGLYNFNAAAALTDTVVAGNAAGTGPDVDNAGTITAAFSLIGDGTASGVTSGNHNQVGTSASPLHALLGPLGYYGGPAQTMPLLPGSPARGRGTTSGAPATDQRGFARVVGGQVDVGAFQTQAGIVVTTTADPGRTSGKLSLREAIALADAVGGNPTITFGAAFNAPQTITLGGSALQVRTADLTILGPAAPLTVSGNHESRVFEIGEYPHNPKVTITNLTVTQGYARGGEGGGIFVLPVVTLTLTNCTVTGNTADNGGGGILLGFYASLTLTNCTLSDNLTPGGFGGGLDNFSGTATLTNCTLAGNSAYGVGGTLFNDEGGTATLTDCTLTGNSASHGGGLANAGKATLTNCTLSGNTAAIYGGAISNHAIYSAPTATLTNCTVSGNAAADVAGGVENVDGTLTLTDTLVAGNTGGTSPDLLNADLTQGTITAAYSLVGDGTQSGVANGVNHNLVGSHNNPLNPLLAPLGNYGGPTQTMALLPGSPALEAGIATGLVKFDQRGRIRVGAVDIGAFESQGFTLTVTAGNNQSAGLNAPFATALTVRVTAVNPVEPVAGGVLTFTAPTAGARGTFLSGAATARVAVGVNRQAIAPAFTANGTAGGYTVTASAAGAASPAAFHLTNVGPPAALFGPLPPVLAAGATSYAITILYTSPLGIDLTTLGQDQVTVTGPNNFSQAAAYVGYASNGGGTVVKITYRLTPPGGSWDAGVNGTYRVTLTASRVKDKFGQLAPSGATGTFLVHTH